MCACSVYQKEIDHLLILLLCFIFQNWHKCWSYCFTIYKVRIKCLSQIFTHFSIFLLFSQQHLGRAPQANGKMSKQHKTNKYRFKCSLKYSSKYKFRFSHIFYLFGQHHLGKAPQAHGKMSKQDKSCLSPRRTQQCSMTWRWSHIISPF